MSTSNTKAKATTASNTAAKAASNVINVSKQAVENFAKMSNEAASQGYEQAMQFTKENAEKGKHSGFQKLRANCKLRKRKHGCNDGCV